MSILSRRLPPLGEQYVRCHFRVKDSGIGMTQEFQERFLILLPEKRRRRLIKIEGTGLSMAITKAIVDTMKGSIELHSAPGKGSEFHITLDLEKADVKVEDMKLPPWRMLLWLTTTKISVKACGPSHQ